MPKVTLDVSNIDFENNIKHMSDSVFKQDILRRSVWSTLDDELSSKIFLAKHGDNFLYYYGACMSESQVKHLGTFIVEKLKESNVKRSDYYAAVAYMLIFNEVISIEKLKEIYTYIEKSKNAESLIKKINKNKLLSKKLQSKGSQRKTRLTETDEMVKIILKKEGLNEVNIKSELRCKYGITADELPIIYDKNGKKLKDYVLAYLLVTHGREDYPKCDLYEMPGLRPEAAKVLSMIDEKGFQNTLMKLANDYLLLSEKPAYNEKIYCLFFPICRYANEENIAYIADFYDKQKSKFDNLPLALFYSETRAAWLFAEETGYTMHYARVRKMSANESRALLYKKTDEDSEPNKEALKKLQEDELFRKYLIGSHWQVNEWHKLYKEVPFLLDLVEPLIWVQGENTFVIAGDEIVDCNGKNYILKKSRIRLAHPMEMKKDEIEIWQSYLKKRGLHPFFNQLGERVYKAKDIKTDRYKGIKIPTRKLRGKEKDGIRFTRTVISFGSASVKISEYDDEKCIVIESFVFEKFTRKLNHIIGCLDVIVEKK